MRSVVIAASLVLVLSAAPGFAQAAAQGRGAQPATPAPGRGALPAPAPPQPQAQIAPAPPPTAPFPQGAKIGLVNLQQIAALSADGKAATTKVQALIQKKQQEG